MSGPWEDYKAESKPWEDFGAPEVKGNGGAVSAPAIPKNTLSEELGRQVGLGWRHLADAALSPLAAGADVISKAGNALIGSDAKTPVFPSHRQLLDKGLDKLFPIPDPQRPIEKFTQDVAQTVAPTLLPATLPVQVAGNAALASAQAPTGDEGTAAALGGASGVVGHVLGKALKVLTPTAEAEFLKSQGVPLTYGQMLGEPVQKVENTLAKVPYVGAPIRARQQEALQGWQQLTRNNAAPGAETVDAVAKKLGDTYDALLKNTKLPTQPTFGYESLINEGTKDLTGVTTAMRTKIETTLREAFSEATTPAEYHKAISNLKATAHAFKSSPEPVNRIYGEALSRTTDGANAAWRQLLPPETQQGLAQVDRAWSQFVPIRSASTKYVATLTEPEKYTPRMLLQALRQRDSTLGKTAFRETPQGKAAVAGEKAIGSASNAPSTPTGIGALVSGGLGSLLGIEPATLAAVTAMGGGYGTKTGQKLLLNTLEGQRAFIDALRRVTPAITRSAQDEQ